jgi:hypothetical protein
METMNDILKEIFNGFAEASRIGQRIQIAADAAMRAEREADEAAKENDDLIMDLDIEHVAHGLVDLLEVKPWNDDLNPQ